MSKSRSKRFEMLYKIADHHEKDVAEKLGMTTKTLNDSALKLEELILFKDEYMKNFYESGKNGMQASQLQTFRSFIEQLDVVIGQQKTVVESAKLNVTKATEIWREKHTKTKIYETSLDRVNKEEQKLQDKAEQKAQDDLSGIASAKKTPIE